MFVGKTWDQIYNALFSLLLMNEPKKLECYKTLPLKGLPGETLELIGATHKL